jgi:hypothetical protein
LIFPKLSAIKITIGLLNGIFDIAGKVSWIEIIDPS